MRFRLTVQVAKLRRTSHPRPSPLLFCSPLVDSTYPLKEKVKTLAGAQGDCRRGGSEHHCSGVAWSHEQIQMQCSAGPGIVETLCALSVDDISFQFKTSHVAEGRTEGRTATPVFHAWPILFIRCPMGVFLSIFSAAPNLFLNAPPLLTSLLSGFGMRIVTQHASQSDCFILMADYGAMIRYIFDLM